MSARARCSVLRSIGTTAGREIRGTPLALNPCPRLVPARAVLGESGPGRWGVGESRDPLFGEEQRQDTEGRSCAQFHSFTVTTMRTSGEAPGGRWHVSGRSRSPAGPRIDPPARGSVAQTMSAPTSRKRGRSLPDYPSRAGRLPRAGCSRKKMPRQSGAKSYTCLPTRRRPAHVCPRGVGGLSLSRPRGRAQGGPNAQPRMHAIDDGTSLGRTMVNDPDRGSRARLSRHLTDLRSTPHRWRRWPLIARPHVSADEPFRVLREVLVDIQSAL